MKHFGQYLVYLMMVMFAMGAFGKDLGKIGQTYEIAERDILEVMQKNLEQNIGDVDVWQNTQLEEVKKYADRPTPVTGLTPTMTTRSWMYDPSVMVEEDVLDEEGSVIVGKGSRIHPLNTLSWTNTLIFYDGDDLAQVRWVKEEVKKWGEKVTLILTNGSISKETEQMNLPVYFDQGGKLINKFNIQHVPAKIEQENNWLRVTETKP